MRDYFLIGTDARSAAPTILAGPLRCACARDARRCWGYDPTACPPYRMHAAEDVICAATLERRRRDGEVFEDWRC